MKTQNRFFHAIALLLLTTALFGCDNGGKDDKKDSGKDEDKKEEIAIPVETSVVTTGSISAYYSATTTLEAEHEASVVAKVGGVVEKYFVEEGESVKAGQTLVQLETDRLKLELSRSEANLNKLKNDLERTSAVYKKHLVSSESYEKLKYEYDSQLAEYELSKLELTFATVVAPIDGVISIRHVKVGNMITINEAVYHITDFDPLHAVIFVPEKELYKIKTQQIVNIAVDAQPNSIFQGFVKRISPIVDASSGTFKVTVEVSDLEHTLKPGMFGRLQIIHDQHESALLIEKKALLSEDSVSSVFVVRDGRAFKQIIKVGYIDNKKIEVLSGLKLDDVIVITGQNSLKNDSLIEVLGDELETDAEAEEIEEGNTEL